MQDIFKSYWLLLVMVMMFSSCQIKSDDKPNVLWITIEDTSPQFIGCYGNAEAKTPVIDQLASEGIRFTNAFSTGTVCSPSRTAIITGVKTYKTGTGNHRSAFPIPSNIKGFPYYLKQQGYYTSNNKKTDYNVSDEKGYTEEAWHESSDTSGWWNRKADQPFFAVFNFMDSHQSRTMTHTYGWYKKQVLNKLTEEERIGEYEFEMPPFYNDTPKMRKQFARVYNSIKLTDNKIGDLLQRLEEDGLRENTIIVFYADHGEGIPRGKTNGINLGYRVPFVVWFPEKYKHLSPWGSEGVVSDELVSFEDLAPTILSIAGCELPQYLTGRVLMGESRSEEVDHLILSSDRADNGIDMVRTVTDGKYLYSRNYMPFMPQARYIRYMEIGDIKQIMRKDLDEGRLNDLQQSLFEQRPAEFLYDIEADQWETVNLVNAPEYATVLNKMRKQLEAEILSAHDILFLPEYEIAKLSETTTAYEYRLSNDYDLEEIYNSAKLSGLRDEQVAKQQVELLKDSNDVVRYWAVIGLRAQTKEVQKLVSEKIRQAMEDTYAPVAITASAIMYELEDNSIAQEKLKQFCMHNNEYLALMTTNYLLYVSDKKPFVEIVTASRQMEGRSYNVKASAADFLGSLGLLPNNPSHRQ